MKTLRLLTIVSLAILLFSSLGPAPVYAKSSSPAATSTIVLTIDPAKSKAVKLIVNNRTGGSLYVKLSGQASYNFATSKQGKTTFNNIKPGVYTISVSSSACKGSLNYKKNFKGTVTLKTFICRKH
ncbi:MAG: DUF6759 domain-containing protein [Bacteroidota bacterium]